MRQILLTYRRLSQSQRTSLGIIAILVAVLLFPTVLNVQKRTRLHEANMYFLNPPEKAGRGESFPVELRVKTNGTSINAVQASVRFNPLYVEILNLTTEKSFCSFYLEHTFDNIKGEANIACGAANPGFQGDSVVVHLNMRAKIPGNTEISVFSSSAQALANTGKGENILKEAPKFNLAITQLF